MGLDRALHLTDGYGDYSIARAGRSTTASPSSDYKDGYADEYYDNARHYFDADADAVSVTSAGSRRGQRRPGRRRPHHGQVTGPGDTGSLDGIRVVAYEEVVAEDGVSYYDYVTSETTEADGSYDLSGLAAGDYRIRFEDDVDGERTYATEYYENARALEGSATTDVAVQTAGRVQDIDAQLELDSGSRAPSPVPVTTAPARRRG